MILRPYDVSIALAADGAVSRFRSDLVRPGEAGGRSCGQPLPIQPLIKNRTRGLRSSAQGMSEAALQGQRRSRFANAASRFRWVTALCPCYKSGTIQVRREIDRDMVKQRHFRGNRIDGSKCDACRRVNCNEHDRCVLGPVCSRSHLLYCVLKAVSSISLPFASLIQAV